MRRPIVCIRRSTSSISSTFTMFEGRGEISSTPGGPAAASRAQG